MTEHAIQKALIELLARAAPRGILWFAVPNGGHRFKATAGKLRAEGVKAGIPDIVLIIRGIAHGLELKTPRGRQSPSQKAVEGQWQAAGGRYVVAYGLDHAIATLRAWGALRATSGGSVHVELEGAS